jgi:site-specific DNA recombinase
VSMIFDLYTRKKLGSRAIAARLTEQGHRSRPGKLWSHVRVLGVLRNPVYMGKIAFRQNEYDGPHPRLVEPEAFEAARRLLRLRGEDGSKRRSNTTEYLLSGLVRCARCGHRYIGTAAHGRSGRYRYYTCFARNRHGRSGCTADVLPADELDRAVIEGLLETYADVNLIDRLRAKLQEVEAAAQPKVRSEMETVDAEISQAEAGVDRYYTAFETGRLPEGRFAKRIEALERRLTALRARKTVLEESTATRPEVPTGLVIHETAEAIAEAMTRGTLQQRKALLQQLVAGVEVKSREEIVPTFRIPATTVRVMDRMVGRCGLEPHTSALSARRSTS